MVIPCVRREFDKSVVNHDSSSIYQAHFSDLDADSEYSFSVAVVRPGLFGEAPLSPPVDIRVSQPQIDKGMVIISWKLPERSFVRCRSGVRLVTIYFHQRGEEKEAKSANVKNPRMTSIEIRNLKIGITYTFITTLFTNGGESNRSVPYTFTLKRETSSSVKGSEDTKHIPERGKA
ncbi:hypothetical protein HOLleu_14225 [Holothuria leucospilota]|uniref:Fibronectin type-III domain-containing protein n=1 Tax=Holothuria leucospilota TaxID=206669 RepID=A0A9Q1C663_HOLLE|nr:hypothetical protein HOLleu_14225 [Holothuria leucospilota]